MTTQRWIVAWSPKHPALVYSFFHRAFCDELHAKGVRFPVSLKEGVGGRLLCYVSAPNGVSIELMQG